MNGKQILRRGSGKSVSLARERRRAGLLRRKRRYPSRLSILDELINSEILLEHADEMNLVATDAEVEDKFTESKSPYTEEEFQKKLKETGSRWTI